MRLAGQYYERQFVCSFTFLGLDNIQLGFHFNWRQPNLEIHVPFGFCRVGWMGFQDPSDVAYLHFGKRYVARR